MSGAVCGVRLRRSLRSTDGGGAQAPQDGDWGDEGGAQAALEVGEEDRRAFTARTLHVASRLKARSQHPRLPLNLYPALSTPCSLNPMRTTGMLPSCHDVYTISWGGRWRRLQSLKCVAWTHHAGSTREWR